MQKPSPLGTTNYLYDGNNVAEEFDGSGNALARYTQAPNIDQPLSTLRSGATSYYEADALGSITSLTNSSGAIANTYTYDSFGNVTASAGTVTNPIHYTARDADSETGLDYYRARYYDPNSGRFISQDPIGYSGGMNVYRYVRNNPIRFADPSGLCDVARIKLWSSDVITLGRPRSDWSLFAYQDNADSLFPINTIYCHWTREYNTWVQTTTTYLVIETLLRFI